MPENVTKRLNVTFCTGLPLGRRATFTHDGELWIAHQATKHRGIVACLDRAAGALDNVRTHLVQWLSARPEDVSRVAALLVIIARADTLRTELVDEKSAAVTA